MIISTSLNCASLLEHKPIKLVKETAKSAIDDVVISLLRSLRICWYCSWVKTGTEVGEVDDIGAGKIPGSKVV